MSVARIPADLRNRPSMTLDAIADVVTLRRRIAKIGGQIADLDAKRDALDEQKAAAEKDVETILRAHPLAHDDAPAAVARVD